jgi:elongation factor P--(R)-beta-lysine ligase
MKRVRERAAIVAKIRRFFEARDFVEVQTPVLVPSPGLDLHLRAFEVEGGDRGARRWLSTSPEYQMKRLLAQGWARIYQLAPCFRSEEHGPQHNTEFTMLEWYRASADMAQVMDDTEQLVAAVTGGAITIDGRRIDLQPPLTRVSVCEAFERFGGWSRQQTLEAARSDEEGYFRRLVEKVEPGLSQLGCGVFLVDYPVSHASLARSKPGDPALAERFELYAAGVELCNGFGELVDPVEQRARFERQQAERREQGRPVYPIDERFMKDLAGVPPSAGNALGVDRLVALSCGTTDIAVALSFTADEL